MIDSDVALAGDGELKTGSKVVFGKAIAQADARSLGMVFEIGITLDTKKFPPDVNVEPKLTDLRIDLTEFKLRRIADDDQSGDREAAKSLGNDQGQLEIGNQKLRA